MSDPYAKSDAAGKAFDENALSRCNVVELQEHLIALANEYVPNQGLQHRNIIRGITINHILLQKHIDALNNKNSITQYCVIALTVVSIIGSAIQIWYADRADKKETSPTSKVEAQPQSQQSPPQVPTLDPPRQNHPVASPEVVSPQKKKTH